MGELRPPTEPILTSQLEGLNGPLLLKRMWKKLLTTLHEIEGAVAESPILFSGGASNYVNEKGEKVRNTGRDRVNALLSRFNVKFYDPQIHPDTHGREYDNKSDGDAEKKAREKAEVDLYELNDKSIGSVTMLELARDLFDHNVRRVVFLNYSDEAPFNPLGMQNEKARQAHYQEYLKSGRNLREYFKFYSTETPNLYVADQVEELTGDFHEVHVISADKLAGSLLLDIYYRAKKDPQRRIGVFFQGQKDQKGQINLSLPDLESVSPEVMNKVLVDYLSEGNKMRSLIQKYLTEQPAGNTETEVVRNELDAVRKVMKFIRQKRRERQAAIKPELLAVP